MTAKSVSFQNNLIQSHGEHEDNDSAKYEFRLESESDTTLNGLDIDNKVENVLPEDKNIGSNHHNLKVKNKIHPMKLPPIKKIGKKSSLKKQSKSDLIEVSWDKMSYIVEQKSIIPFQTPSVKAVLKCLSGSFRSGELTAVMGPSGAGKSTLLSCVCGKRTTGVSGDVKIKGCNRIRVAIITQDDYLTDRFSVKEALIFASKVKNGSNKVDHEEIINNVLNVLNLGNAMNTKIGNCSGGQRRKISIALELVSKPNILILDEPTSGLDSSSCHQLVNNLRDLTQMKEPVAVVATIHQPSARVFNLFHKIYMLSFNGQCIYHGSPGNLIEQLSRANLSCPTFYNPADYIAEIASGEYGDDCVSRLATNRIELKTIDSNDWIESTHKLSEMSQKYKFPTVLHFFLMMKKNYILTYREPHLFWLRIIFHTLITLFLSFLFGSDLGTFAACPPRMENLYTTKASQLFKDYEYESKRIGDNLGSIFFSTIFFLFGGLMPALMVFPTDMNVFVKQYTNGWYSPLTYFISKIVCDLPIIFIVTTIFITIWYLLTGQILELWRYGLYLFFGIMLEIIGQSQGFIFSAIFSTNIVKASYFGTLSTLPFLLMSGFFVRTKRIPSYLVPLTYFSHLKYAFESMVITIYGFDRCFYQKTNQTLPMPPWLRWFKLMNVNNLENSNEDYTYEDVEEEDTEEKAMKDVLAMISGNTVNTDKYSQFQSMVMSQFEFNDDMLYINIISLIAFAIIFQVISYRVLIWKVKNSSQ